MGALDQNKTSHINRGRQLGENLVIWNSNVDVLTREKIIELRYRIDQEDIPPHIIALSEVKPKYHKRELHLTEYQLDGYNIEHKNIIGESSGRGLIVYTREMLTCNIHEPSTSFEENLFISVKLNNDESLMLGLLYRSPTSSEANNNKLNKLIDEICENNPSRTLLIGDFNFPRIEWTSLTTSATGEGKEFHFIEKIRDKFLTQHVTEPTRCRGSDNPSTLDLVLTNDENLVAAIEVEAPLGKSDHAVIKIQVLATLEQQIGKLEYYNYDKGDYTKIRTQMERNWTADMAPYTRVQDKWDLFRNKYNEAVESHIPKLIPRNRNTYKVPLDHVTLKKIRAKVNKKDKLWKKKRKERTREAEIDYNRVRNQVRALTRKAEKIYEKNIVSKIKENPKKFWMYVRRKTKYRASIPELEIDDTSELTAGNEQKAEVLSKYFASVFTKEPEGEPLDIQEICDNKLEDCDLDADMVKERLSKINIAKSPGPDRIHPRVLRELYDSIHVPLAEVISSSLDTGELPTDWKDAHISAIYKKGPKKKAENYRPVSLTSIVVKIAESIIREEIIRHMRQNKLLSNKQFGFLRGRSMVLQLLVVLDKWTEILDQGGVIDVIYCDFMKAFHKVPHNRLLHKLQSYGISGKVLNWIRAFLLNRRQRVRVQGSFSGWQKVTSGIPQGSVLGPLLFVIYINDLPSVVTNSDPYLFADDTKLFKGIFNASDCAHLQQDLDRMCEWTNTSLLKFHPDKCKQMRIGNRDKLYYCC